MLRLDRADPVAAVALWLSSLALRALSAIFIALWLVMFLPATALFDALTHWCWHTVLPLIATHLGFSGHNLADAATIAPSFVLAASAISVGFGAARAARTVRQLLRRGSIGAGPRGSVIVGGHEVLVAAAGLHRPKLVVSPGALMLLDDDELAAGLEHECGHIQRRHRFILLFAELCRALGRFLPGTRRAMSELTFHLERDADAWALARRHDRYALASAICKTALSHGHGPAFASLAGGGSRLTDRVEAMVDESSTAEIGHPSRRLRCAAGASMLLTLMLVTALPVTVANGKARLNSTDSVHHCPH
jgi:hypothetical protein